MKIVKKNKDTIIIFDSAYKCTYTLGKQEYELLQMFDKNLSVDKIQKQFSQYSIEKIMKLYNIFESKHFFINSNSKIKDFTFLYNSKIVKWIIKILGKEILTFSLPIFIVGIFGILEKIKDGNIFIKLFLELKTNPELFMSM